MQDRYVMNLDKLQEAAKVLKQDQGQRKIPGYEAIVVQNGKKVFHTWGGYAEDSPFGQRALQENFLFDLASLTKVVATTMSLLLLLEQGEIRLQDRVSYFIPTFAKQGKEEITLRQLLTHTSGLVAHREYDKNGWDREMILQQIYETDPVYQADTQMVYSDLGFIVLGEVISQITGEPLDRFVRDYIFNPLGMDDTTYLPKKDHSQLVATEYREKLGRCQCGEVHDENAGALGGVAGHAGLFSTARDLERFAQFWLNEDTERKRLLSPLTVDLATRSYTQGLLNANRGLGWVLKGDRWDASGDLSSPRVFGHTGFTGTSITLDPTYKLGIILLTNRVHYGREPHIIRTRARFHNMVYASLERG